MDISELVQPLIDGAPAPPPVEQIAARARRRHRTRIARATIAVLVVVVGVVFSVNRGSHDATSRVGTVNQPTTVPPATPSSTPLLPAIAPPNRIALTVATPTFGPGLQAAEIVLV